MALFPTSCKSFHEYVLLRRGSPQRGKKSKGGAWLGQNGAGCLALRSPEQYLPATGMDLRAFEGFQAFTRIRSYFLGHIKEPLRWNQLRVSSVFSARL